MKKTTFYQKLRLLFLGSLVVGLSSCGEPQAQEQKNEANKNTNISQTKSQPNNQDKGNRQRSKQDGLEIPAYAPDDMIIRHKNFTLCYSEEHEQAKWVAYQLDAKELKKVTERENNFRPDPRVRTGSSHPDDYKGSGYDRGHLAPAGDFSFSEEAMSESFYMSNMSPQAPQLNREAWRILEETVRDWAKRDRSLLIVTGPILKGKMKKIGKKNKVSVPPAYYKVIVDITEPEKKGIGFIMPNEQAPKGTRAYAVPIRKVEEETGINFFPELEDALENELENYNQWNNWFRKSPKK